MAKFEQVSRFTEELPLPTRATAHAAGYDLYAAEDKVIPSYLHLMEKADIKEIDGQPCQYILSDMATFTKMTGIKPSLVSTGMKVKLADDEYLELLPRSSTPLKYWLVLANSVGIIDSDYYNNSGNEGEIFLQLINFSPADLVIKKGDCIGQGIIHKYYTTEDDCAGGERQGGLGSTH